MRRLRHCLIRDLVQEQRLHSSDLIWPSLFAEGENITEDVASMPDVKRYSVDRIVELARTATELNIPAIALFPKTPEQLKDAVGSEAVNDQI